MGTVEWLETAKEIIGSVSTPLQLWKLNISSELVLYAVRISSLASLAKVVAVTGLKFELSKGLLYYGHGLHTRRFKVHSIGY